MNKTITSSVVERQKGVILFDPNIKNVFFDKAVCVLKNQSNHDIDKKNLSFDFRSIC